MMSESSGQQQFCLKWNNYQTSLTSTFKDLLAQDNFVDVTLTCGLQGQTVNAHRVVLSACSPYFRQVLAGLGQWYHPVVILKDIKYEDLSGIIEFIYHGEVSIDQECLPGFLQAARSLKIKGLTEDAKTNVDTSLPNSQIEETKPKHYLVQKALANLIQGSLPEENFDEGGSLNDQEDTKTTVEDNNNTESAHNLDVINTEVEEEEEAMSESEIRESNLKNLDFQTMYRSFMSRDNSEDSESGGKDAPLVMAEEGVDGAGYGDSDTGLGGKKTCPFCFQQLSWHALSRHIRDMHRAKSNLVTCQYCLKTFRNKNSLGCHIWRFHKRGKELIGQANRGQHSAEAMY